MTSIDENKAREFGLPRDDHVEILHQQVDILKTLNDELLRTIRVHAILGGLFITAVSFFGIDSVTPDQPGGGSLFWRILALLGVLAGILWLLQIASARVSYSNLRLGVWPDAPHPDEKRDNSMTIKEAAVFVLFPRNQSDIEESFGKEEYKHQMLAPDIETAIEHNNWIIATRESYVNSVQAGLNLSFSLAVVVMFGLGLT